MDDELVFLSNGEAGVHVAVAEESLETPRCSWPATTVLGPLRFDDLESVNHVAYEDEYPFVAAGLGGLKIVWVDFDG